MNSSDSSRSVDLQSASLPGRLSRRCVTDLRLTSAAASRDASRALAASTMRPTIWSAAVLLVLSQASSAGPHEVVDRGRHLRIVELLLGLPLEHRLAHEDRQDADDALADVLGGDVEALDLDLVRLHVVADGLDDAALEAALVRAAGRRCGCR